MDNSNILMIPKKIEMPCNFLFLCLFLPQILALEILPDPDGFYRIERTLSQNSFNFSVYGDWGGFPRPFYTTPIQLNTAKLLSKISDQADSQFTLAVGDNFYFWGVKSILDPRFAKTFENIYTAKSLQKPWYPLNGNHDWQGTDHVQEKYSEISNRWTFPSYYYTINYKFGSDSATNQKPKSLKLIMLDSQVQCDVGETAQRDRQYDRLITEQERLDQLTWLENELKNSKSDDFVFLVSHYQYVTPFQIATYKCMEPVNDLILKYQVPIHFYGHEHYLSHVTPKENQPGYGQIHYVLSGNGALTNPGPTDDRDPNPTMNVHYYERSWKNFGGGFVMVEMTENEAKIRFYHNKNLGDREVIPTYEFSVPARQNN